MTPPVENENLPFLIVDDHGPNLIVLGCYLEVLGHTYVAAHSGQEAVDLFVRQDFAGVLLDLQMPLLNGFEVARFVRHFEEKTGRAPIPIIALSAYLQAEDRKMCFESGMDAFLSKPYSMTELASAIHHTARLSPHPRGLMAPLHDHAPREQALQE